MDRFRLKLYIKKTYRGSVPHKARGDTSSKTYSNTRGCAETVLTWVTGVLLTLLFLGLSLPAAAERQETFLDYINAKGTSVDDAIVIKNISNYSGCDSKECMDAELLKSIKQEYTYIRNRFGVSGVNWEYHNDKFLEEDTEVDFVENDRQYDKLIIRLLPSQELKVIYFDITDPIEAYRKNLNSFY